MIFFFFLGVRQTLRHRTTGEEHDMLALCLEWRGELARLLNTLTDEASNGEMAALISYAIAFPDGFMALVDTYDVQRYFLGHAYYILRGLSLLLATGWLITLICNDLTVFV